MSASGTSVGAVSSAPRTAVLTPSAPRYATSASNASSIARRCRRTSTMLQGTWLHTPDDAGEQMVGRLRWNLRARRARGRAKRAGSEDPAGSARRGEGREPLADLIRLEQHQVVQERNQVGLLLGRRRREGVA